MKAEQLITEHIDLWTSTVRTKNTQGRSSGKKRELYGVKKLRELILELAVRGKLVAQDSSDEPASVLLKKILAEKSRLIKEKKIKKSKPLPQIGEDEIPFCKPDGWAWCKLGDLTEMYNGRAFKSSEWSETGIPIVRIQNLNNENAGFNYFSGELLDSNRIDNGSFLISWSGTPGTSFGAFIWSGGECALNQHINKCVFNYSEINLKFMRLAVNGCMSHFISKAQGGVGLKHVTKGTLNNAIICLPPEEEQHRVVAKVDELMTLCDQLEQQTESSLNAHNLLVDTLLATLTDACDANELSANWARLAEHFDTLITTDYAVEQLKQTILQLAVMGKLVPQDPNDEPASELLKRIVAEKEQLIQDKKLKKQKPLPEITDEEKLFELPEGWEWIKFGELAEFINGDRGKNYPNKSEYVDNGVPWINTGHIKPDGTLNSTSMNFITEEKFSELRSGKVKDGDLVYCLRGATFGKTAFVTPYGRGAIASSLMIIRPYYAGLGAFIFRYLTSELGRSQIFRFDNGSAQPNLSANSVRLYAFPCPPFKEQIRICDKINQLMALCKGLDSCLKEAQATRLQLADTIVDEALT